MIDENKLIDDLKESGMIVDNEYGNAMLDMINKQPKINDWIPCSERLPAEPVPDGFYDPDGVKKTRTKGTRTESLRRGI